MSTRLNWEKVREEFPACQGRSYLMNACVTLLHREVHEAIRSHVDHIHLKGFEGFDVVGDIIDSYRKCTAEILEAEPEDIALSPNTSLSMNLLAMALRSRRETPNVVLPKDEFPSSVLAWHQQGYEVRLVPSKEGRVSIQDMLDQIDSNTVAVVSSFVQFSTGFRQNLRLLGNELRALSIPFIVNATQGFGAFPISVKDCHISALTASAHKWIGAGCGGSVFYASPEFRKSIRWPVAGWMSVKNPWELSNNTPDLLESAAAIELGTPHAGMFFGLNAAAKVVLDLGIENIAERIFDLSNQVVHGLKKLNRVILSPRDEHPTFEGSMNSGIISFATDHAEDLEKKLQEENVYVSARRNGVRISIHYFNNENDIERLLQALRKNIA